MLCFRQGMLQAVTPSCTLLLHVEWPLYYRSILCACSVTAELNRVKPEYCCVVDCMLADTIKPPSTEWTRSTMNSQSAYKYRDHTAEICLTWEIAGRKSRFNFDVRFSSCHVLVDSCYSALCKFILSELWRRLWFQDKTDASQRGPSRPISFVCVKLLRWCTNTISRHKAVSRHSWVIRKYPA